MGVSTGCAGGPYKPARMSRSLVTGGFDSRNPYHWNIDMSFLFGVAVGFLICLVWAMLVIGKAIDAVETAEPEKPVFDPMMY